MAEIVDDFARRVVTGRAGDPAARMGARPAHVQPRHRRPVIRMAGK